jgi:hypothetical protein
MQTDKPTRALPHPGSPEASAMMDSMLAEYQWPANTKNAARAGWEAANRWLASSLPPPGGEPKRTDKDYAIEHAGYLATAARNYMMAVGAEAVARMDDENDGTEDTAEKVEQALESLSDAGRSLSGAIYEFEKRRDRAAGVRGPGRFRLDIDESAIYEGDCRVLELDTGGGVENYTNDNWRAANDLGARIVDLLNAHGVGVLAGETKREEKP